MDDKINGHEAITVDEVIADIKQLSARLTHPKQLTVIEAVPVAPGIAPFEQKSHSLLIESIDRIAQDWIKELKHVRDNTLAIEQLVLEAATKAKDDVTRMHLLGAQVLQEAQRGQDICSQLHRQLDQIMGSQAP